MQIKFHAIHIVSINVIIASSEDSSVNANHNMKISWCWLEFLILFKAGFNWSSKNNYILS